MTTPTLDNNIAQNLIINPTSPEVTKPTVNGGVATLELREPAIKSVSVTHSSNDTAKTELFGHVDAWVLICKAYNKQQGWMKSTKAMNIPFFGHVIQTETEIKGVSSQALTSVPGVYVKMVNNKPVYEPIKL